MQKKCAARADVRVAFAVAPLASYLSLRNTLTDFRSSPEAVYKYLISLQSQLREWPYGEFALHYLPTFEGLQSKDIEGSPKPSGQNLYCPTSLVIRVMSRISLLSSISSV